MKDKINIYHCSPFTSKEPIVQFILGPLNTLSLKYLLIIYDKK